MENKECWPKTKTKWEKANEEELTNRKRRRRRRSKGVTGNLLLYRQKGSYKSQPEAVCVIGIMYVFVYLCVYVYTEWLAKERSLVKENEKKASGRKRYYYTLLYISYPYLGTLLFLSLQPYLLWIRIYLADKALACQIELRMKIFKLL